MSVCEYLVSGIADEGPSQKLYPEVKPVASRSLCGPPFPGDRRQTHGQKHSRPWELAYSYDGPRRSMRAQALCIHSIHLLKIVHVKQEGVHMDYMLQVRICKR